MRIHKLNRIIGVLGTLLVLLAFSACNPQNEAAGEATLVVSVEDATSKLIGPDAENVDISHYRITVSNDNGAIAVSDLLPKNNAYTLTGLVPGEWDILAEGYVKPDASTDAVKVAGKSESIQLTAGSNPVKITLDKLDETPAGTVSITLLLPPEVVSGSSFQYWYSVVDMSGDEVMSSGSEMAPITGICTGDEGSFDITGINQGSYLLFVSVNTPEGVVTAVDAMRLIAGLDAVGTLDFSGSSDTPTLDTGLTVEDAIGNMLKLGDMDGMTFNITGADLEIGLPNAYEYHWYLDGSEWDGYVSETENGTSETTFAVGNLEGISAARHVLSVVAVIPGTQIGVGSVELIVNKVELAIGGKPEVLYKHGKNFYQYPVLSYSWDELRGASLTTNWAISDYIEASGNNILCAALYDSNGKNITESIIRSCGLENIIICDGEQMVPVSATCIANPDIIDAFSYYDYDAKELVYNLSNSSQFSLVEYLKYAFSVDSSLYESSMQTLDNMYIYAVTAEYDSETNTIHISDNYSAPTKLSDLMLLESLQNWVPGKPSVKIKQGKVYCERYSLNFTDGDRYPDPEEVEILYSITDRASEENTFYRNHDSFLYSLGVDKLNEYIFPTDGISISVDDYGQSLEMVAVRLDSDGSIKEASPLMVYYITETGELEDYYVAVLPEGP